MRLVFQDYARRRATKPFCLPTMAVRACWVREVYLCCDDTPVVFAHSVVRPRDMRGRGKRWQGSAAARSAAVCSPIRGWSAARCIRKS